MGAPEMTTYMDEKKKREKENREIRKVVLDRAKGVISKILEKLGDGWRVDNSGHFFRFMFGDFTSCFEMSNQVSGTWRYRRETGKLMIKFQDGARNRYGYGYHTKVYPEPKKGFDVDLWAERISAEHKRLTEETKRRNEDNKKREHWAEIAERLGDKYGECVSYDCNGLGLHFSGLDEATANYLLKCYQNQLKK